MNILKEAESIIYGDREQTYGRPDKNLVAIADLWNAYLINRPDEPLTADDICYMMVMLKIARLINTPRHHDSLVDMCGYTALVARVAEYEETHPEDITYANPI